MGLGIPSITNAVPGTPLPLPDYLPVEQVGEVIDSPTEELPSAPFDELLPNAPGVTAPSVPQTPDLPVKPPVPDTSSLPLPDDDLMKLLADEDNIVSAMTQEAMAATSEGAPVDPYVLIDRLEQFKAANERIENSFGFVSAPIQGATGALPVRRQAPALVDLFSTLKALVESGQLDHMSTCFTIPPFPFCHSCPVLVPAATPDQLAPPNSPLAYAWNVPSTLVTGPPESIPTEMLDVSAVPFPPPTSPAVVASSVPIAHDDPTMVTSALPLSRLPAAPTPSLDAPFSSENDSGEPFAAAVLAPGWEWSETTGVERPAPNPPSLPTPSLMGARDFKPTAPIGQLSNKELPPLLAAPKEKRASKLRLSADR